MKILLVEDTVALADALKKNLHAEGYAVDVVSDGTKALTRISLHRADYDVIILDLQLPSMNGDVVCSEVRRKKISTPILILTARTETDVKVRLLTSGADDYLCKPFSFPELHARLQALVRRPIQTVPQILLIGNISLDQHSRTVMNAQEQVTLTLKEYALLEYFLKNQNKVISREDLLTHV